MRRYIKRRFCSAAYGGAIIWTQCVQRDGDRDKEGDGADSNVYCTETTATWR